MIEHFKKEKHITQKEINEATGIPKSNYRRAQIKGFVGYGKMVEKMAKYLGAKTRVSQSVIEEMDENFSHFYTCICFSKIEEAKKYYDLIVEKFEYYDNSILLIPYYLSQLIYYISEINFSNTTNYPKLDEAVEFLKCFVDKMSNEHRFLYYEYMACFSAFNKDSEKVVHYARLTTYLAANYPELEPTANYHVSFSYSLISDFINALIYANKALPKLEEQLNYNKAVFCRINIATLYKKLGNIDESKKLLKKNLVYMTFNSVGKLLRATYLNYADCLLYEKNYVEALKYYLLIENDLLHKHDYESIMITYCLFMSEKTDQANEFVSKLNILANDKKYSFEYLTIINFFYNYFNHETEQIVESSYQLAEEYMPGYKLRGSYIQDIAKRLYEKNPPKKRTTPSRDTSYNEYII